MLRNVYLTCLLTLIFGSAAWAQSGSIKGRVLDKTTNEPLPFASVIAVMNGRGFLLRYQSNIQTIYLFG